MDRIIAGRIEYTPTDATSLDRWQRFYELCIEYGAIARKRAADNAAGAPHKTTETVPDAALRREYQPGGQSPSATARQTRVN